MELIRPGTKIDFVGKRRIAYGLSLSMVAVTILLYFWRGGLNIGLDFAGGTMVHVRLAKTHTSTEIKGALRSVGLEDSVIQEFSEEGKAEYLIRISKTNIQVEGIGEQVTQTLAANLGEEVELRRVEMVGPQVGKDLRNKALFAIFYSMLFMAVYISGRFEMKWTISIVMAAALFLVTYAGSALGMPVAWLIIIALMVTLGLCVVLRLKYALGAIVALIHDVVITVGAFVLTDREISLTTVAALLTIVGYSVNDTIIIFDRIRENLRRSRRQDFETLINDSVNQTLSRTILTSGTTLLVVAALYFLGGGVIHDFAFALLVGIVSGTYSTVYIASPILMLFEKKPPMRVKGQEPVQLAHSHEA